MSNPRVNSLRVAPPHWLDEDKLEKLLSMLDEYPCSIEYIHLFTSFTHTPLTLAETKKRTEIMKERFKLIRAHGFKPGVNILATIGHHCEDLDNCLHGEYYRMTNIVGEIIKGCFCMNDERFLNEYIAPVYTMLAETGAEVIWIDDDVRYWHGDNGHGCFCDGCIARFNEVNGTSYTRETLKKALSVENVPLRKAWLRHNADAIKRLFSLIGKTVRAVSPDIMLGFMTGDRFFEGYDFAGFAEALSDGGKYNICWRPGGGAYSDFNCIEFTRKASQIGRQNAYLPEYVTVNHSEIENFNYEFIKKTAKSTAVEAALYMSAGCTGAAFNILSSENNEPVENNLYHLKAIDKLTPFYNKLNELFSGRKPCGIHTFCRPDSHAALPAGNWTEMYVDVFYNMELFTFGLPECYHPSKASVTTLLGNACAVMSDEEIRELLSGGVYMDATALDYLNSRGFGEYTGFTLGEAIPVDALEKYTDHPINKGVTGCIRNGRQAFNAGLSVAIHPTAETAESLSKIVDYHDKNQADCTLGIFENSLGGRIAVAGYYPYSMISSTPKTAQLKNLFKWLGEKNGEIPALVETYCRIRCTALVGEDGHMCVTLFNFSNEIQENISISVATDADTAAVVTMDCSEYEAALTKTDDSRKSLTVKQIQPFEMAVVVI